MKDRNNQKILQLKRRILEDFTAENWVELGLITDCTHLIEQHSRLLRSLHFGDEDYSGIICCEDKIDLKIIELIYSNVPLRGISR